MLTSISNLLAATTFMPHGTCYLWKPGLVGLHVVSNAVIALAYFSIPLTLIYIVRKRKDIPFGKLFFLFASFIIFCGIGHLCDIWTLWHANYWLSGYIRAITAVVSLVTAIVLIYLIPQILQVPSPKQMQDKNQQLELEIKQRQQIASELQQKQQFLEALLDNLSDGIVACNADGVLTLFNRATREFHGLGEKPLPSEQWAQYYDLYLADGVTPMKQEEIPLFRALQGESVQNMEMTIVPKEGHKRHIVTNGAPIMTAQGEKLGAVVAMRDITESKQALEKLQKSEERWQLALTGTGDGIFDWNMVTNEAFMSVPLKEMLGYTDAEIPNCFEGWRNLVHPEDLERAEEALQIHLEQHTKLYQVEYRLLCKDGSYKWILARGQAKWDEQGNPVRMVGSHQDISQRKQAEAALQESEMRYRLLAENANDLIATYTPEGIYLYLSPVCRYLLGYEPQDMQGHVIYDFFHPEDAGALQRTQAAIGQFPDNYTHSYRVRRADGSYIWLETTNKLVRHPEQTNLDLILSISRDITERKQAEAEIARLNAELEQRVRKRTAQLEASESQYSAVVNSVREVIFQTDRDGKWTFLNPAWTKITGFAVEQSLGNLWLNYVYGEGDRERAKECFQALQAGDTESCQQEFRCQTQGGEFRWLEMYMGANFNPQGEIVSTSGTLYDVTERKQTEAILQARANELANMNTVLLATTAQLERRNQELDQFAYVTSHDLKAPLRAISNLSQWIEEDLEDKLDEDTQQQMNLLRGRVQRMENLINGLLQYSRVGRIVGEAKEVHVGELLAEIVDSLSVPQGFTIEMCGEMPTLVTQDLPLQQVFSNLISNAIKHHNREDGKVNISVEDRGNYYRFAVADNGVGIAPEYHEKVFVIFQTLEARDTKENTGIGLSIVKKIVEAQGGEIGIESQVDEGATFWFTWQKSSDK